MISFDLECDGSGGLVLIEKNKLDSLSQELGAILNIVVDVEGETELVADYPGEKWRDVWRRETARLKDLCQGGLMFVGLLEEGEYSAELNISDEVSAEDVLGVVNVSESPLLVVEAGELIQKVIYPQLPLDVLSEVELEHGNYGVGCKLSDADKIVVTLTSIDSLASGEAVVELSSRDV